MLFKDLLSTAIICSLYLAYSNAWSVCNKSSAILLQLHTPLEGYKSSPTVWKFYNLGKDLTDTLDY